MLYIEHTFDVVATYYNNDAILIIIIIIMISYDYLSQFLESFHGQILYIGMLLVYAITSFFFLSVQYFLSADQ